MAKTEGSSYDKNKSTGTMEADDSELMKIIHSVRIKNGLFRKTAVIDGACRKDHYKIVHDMKTGKILMQRPLTDDELEKYFRKQKDG